MGGLWRATLRPLRHFRAGAAAAAHHLRVPGSSRAVAASGLYETSRRAPSAPSEGLHVMCLEWAVLRQAQELICSFRLPDSEANSGDWLSRYGTFYENPRVTSGSGARKRTNDMEAMLDAPLKEVRAGCLGYGIRSGCPPWTHTFRTNSAWPEGYAEAPLHVVGPLLVPCEGRFFQLNMPA